MRSPLTGTQACVKTKVIEAADLRALWIRDYDIDLGDSFQALQTIELWKCLDTGLLWYEPSEAAAKSEIYTKLEKFDWYYKEDKWEFHRALAEIRSGDSLLEIGSGAGHFLKLATKRGAKVSGVELNANAAESLRAQGYETFDLDPFENLKLERRSFDCVCAFQVLEHVAKPGEIIQMMLSVLRSGGKLILSVPNSEVMALLDPEYIELLDQPPHHMSKWSCKTFEKLQNLFPIRLVNVAFEPLQPCHIGWYLYALKRRLIKALGPRIGSSILNPLTALIAKEMLARGGRKLLKGHTLMVVFEKY